MAIGETVGQRDPVVESDILKRDSSLAGVDVDLDGIGGNHARGSNPKGAVRKGDNAGIVGMNRASRAREDIQSDEDKGAVMGFAIDADVLAGHEPIIEGQGQGIAVFIGPGARASGNADETFEIRDH